MQKVVGSSPIIRFAKAPLDGVFVCRTGADCASCTRKCKRTWSDVPRVDLLLASLERTPILAVMRLSPVTWLGRVSYSVYLWHVPLIVALAIGPTATPREQIAGLILIFAFAVGSYYLVEQPVRRRRAASIPTVSAAPGSRVPSHPAPGGRLARGCHDIGRGVGRYRGSSRARRPLPREAGEGTGG